ncbi:MAG: small multi-drug export protein [Clostridia bacterium]
MLQKYMWVFFISMLPFIELRGAIPYAQSQHLAILPYYSIAIIGNMLPIPFIYFFAHKIFVWGSDKAIIGKLFSWCVVKGEAGGKSLQAKASKNGIFIALMIFVGIPLPGTGAWTGALAASILKLDFKSSMVAIFGGILIASVIMVAASAGFFGALGFLS